MKKLHKVIIVAVIVIMLAMSFACVVDDNTVRVLSPEGQKADGETCPLGTEGQETGAGTICVPVSGE